jgi:hypothetical protein
MGNKFCDDKNVIISSHVFCIFGNLEVKSEFRPEFSLVTTSSPSTQLPTGAIEFGTHWPRSQIFPEAQVVPTAAPIGGLSAPTRGEYMQVLVFVLGLQNKAVHIVADLYLKI